MQHWAESAIILVLLSGNVLVRFCEEYQAGNAIDALTAQLELKARAKRDGQWRVIAARGLVLGGLFCLRLGDIVPADATVKDGEEIQVDQSALTGESLPDSRATGQQVYSGSIVRQGEVDALVPITGGNTYFGKTSQMVESTGTPAK